MDQSTPYTDPTYRKDQCLFIDWPSGNYHPFINKNTIRKQDPSAKALLFDRMTAKLQEMYERGDETLHRLRILDEVAASHFDVKQRGVDDLTFRLVNGESTEVPKTYIALSYRWPQSTTETEPDQMTRMPLDPILFQQLVNERKCADEGLWCDQLCIQQTDERERDCTVAAMDLIYKCARLVVVALTDVEVTQEERLSLEALVKDYVDDKRSAFHPPHFDDDPPLMSKRPILLGFLLRILDSDYFTRAWCLHELKLGQAHLFIMRCSSSSTERSTVCTLTGQFLGYLVLLSSRVAKPPRAFRTIQTLHSLFDWDTAIKRLYGSNRSEEMITEDSKRVDLCPPVIQEVFSLNASGSPNAFDPERDANLDRITIILNTLAIGVTLNRGVSATSKRTISRYHCMHLVLLVALAAGDPTSLCTLGRPLEFGRSEQSSSWLCEPHFSDIGMGALRRQALPRMHAFRCELDLSPLAEWIRLDGLLLGNPESIPESWLDTASKVIDKCIELDYGGGQFGFMSSGPQYRNWRIQWDAPWSRTLFGLTVAAILEMGPRWLLGMASSCGFNDNSVTQELAASIAKYFSDGFNQDYIANLSWTQSTEASNAVDWILRTAHFMVAMLQTQISSKEREIYVPYIFSRGWSRKVLVLAPSDALLHAVIPVALLRTEYARLPRVWLLQDTGDRWGKMLDTTASGHQPRLFIRTKSVLFGNIPVGDYQLQAESQHIGYGMRIYGRMACVDGRSETKTA